MRSPSYLNFLSLFDFSCLDFNLKKSQDKALPCHFLIPGFLFSMNLGIHQKKNQIHGGNQNGIYIINNQKRKSNNLFFTLKITRSN